MKKLIPLAILATLLSSGFAQTPTQVSLASKGDDVRVVLHDLFAQTKKSYVLEPNIRFVLFLSLNDVEFEEALALVCKTAGLKYEMQNGIYFIGKAAAAKPAPAAPVQTAPKEEPKTLLTPAPKAEPKPVLPVVKPLPKPIAKPTQTKVTLPKVTAGSSAIKVQDKAPQSASLAKKVTVRVSKFDIRAMFTELGRQAGVPIEVDAKVPAYRLDALLKDVTLKAALDKICAAAGLKYSVTARQSIQIVKA